MDTLKTLVVNGAKYNEKNEKESVNNLITAKINTEDNILDITYNNNDIEKKNIQFGIDTENLNNMNYLIITKNQK